MILVTGSTGFIGNHLARLLAGQGQRLRLLVRASSDVSTLLDLDAEVCSGDLLDRQSLLRAATGCSTVFHVAAEYSLWSPNPDSLVAVNVEGTENLLWAARRAGVERTVYTSSVGTIAPDPDGQPLSEASPSSLAAMIGPYKRSKYMAERIALQAAAKGQPVVLVSPTAPVGERDFKPTPTGRIILDFLEGQLPAYVRTGLNFVDVRDVAMGHWLAARHGRIGESYLIGAENLSLRSFLEEVAKASGRHPPRIRIPYAAAWTAGAACSLWSALTRRPPAIPLDGVRMARHSMYADCSKARLELGFRPGPVRRAVRRAVHWFQAQTVESGVPGERPPRRA